MPQFTYRAKKGPKEIVEGVLDAENRHAAIARLTAMQLFPLRVEERDALSGQKPTLALPSRRKLGAKDLAVFDRQLADLIDAGLPLLRSLEVLREQTASATLNQILTSLIEDIRAGSQLSQAMGKFPKVFDPVTVSMVHSGEVGGMLNTVLARLADFSEKDNETKSKIRSAMAYPLFLSLMGVVTIVILMMFVIPKLVPVFQETGQALPLPTQILLWISALFRDYWWLLAGIIVLGVVTFQRRMKTPEGRKAFDQSALKIPVAGPLLKKSQIARFSRTLAALLANGVPVLQSLKIATDGVSNLVLREELEKISEDISRGQQLGDSMKKSLIFPPFVVNMVVVGEQGGLLERALDKVADSYEKEVDRSIKFVTTMLEPLMILVMGGLVGFIVMAMLLPIFSINMAAQ